MPSGETKLTRRGFLAGSIATAVAATAGFSRVRGDDLEGKALISITLDLEMSRHYPKRGMMEWDFRKGDLDDDTKKYSVEAGRVAKELGGKIHYFCVGRTLEQPDVEWLKGLAKAGHPIGNHTYDHVNVQATSIPQAQFRFERSPWLARGLSADALIKENIKLASVAMKERAGIEANGFRTPGGFHKGLDERPDLQRMFLDLGFQWISSKYPAHLVGKEHEEPTAEVYAAIVAAQKQAQPYVYPQTGLIEVPMSPVSDVSTYRSLFWKREWFLRAVRLGVEWAIENRACYDFLAHPSCLVVEDPQFEAVRLICDLVKKAGDRAAIVGLDALAERAKAMKSGKS
ncbi:MAG: polysaccharide deacetylase family protein [Planctomycetaceae bacterium]